jgi:hypothetical protein
MSTSTDLANRSLSEHLGVTKIDDITGTDDISEKCLLAYNASRQSVLTVHRWKFAERRVALAIASSVEVIGFTYSYTYPSDCLIIRRMYNPNSEHENIAYTTTTDVTKTLHYINTDQEDAVLIYTADVNSVPLLPPLFQDALVLDMASKLAMSIKRDREMSFALKELFFPALQMAINADSANQYVEPQENNSYTTAIRG